MPYDARPVSEGGNRGAGETFGFAAPKGKFRVICVDTFDGGDWVHGDFDTKDAAIKAAAAKGGNMLRAYVYDDAARQVSNAGTF